MKIWSKIIPIIKNAYVSLFLAVIPGHVSRGSVSPDNASRGSVSPDNASHVNVSLDNASHGNASLDNVTLVVRIKSKVLRKQLFCLFRTCLL